MREFAHTRFHDFRVITYRIYRDDTDEISREPRTKRLKIRRESLPRPSKHTSNSLRAHIYLYMFPKTSYAPSVLHARLRSYAISRFSCHHILHSSSSSSSSSLNRLSPYQYQFKRCHFFTESLQFRRRCARTSSDRLFLVASLPWSSCTQHQ